MLFAVTGILKEGAEEKLTPLHEAFNEHLAQPFRRVRLAGPLRSAEGHTLGYMVLMEADGHDEANAYLQESPVFRAALYDRVQVAEFALEVGWLA